MKCPNCGAEATCNFCNYCGSELPKKQEAMNINGNVTINNYYQYPNEPNESDYDEEYEEDEDFDFEEEKESGFSIASLVCFILAIFFACGVAPLGIIFSISSIIFALIAYFDGKGSCKCANIVFWANIIGVVLMVIVAVLIQ